MKAIFELENKAMGFGINSADDGDDVVGYLTVDKAFEYFEKQWKKDGGK